MTEEYSPVSVNRDVGTEQPSLWIHSSEEPSSTEREHKRITHNNSEKQRKEKIKSKIANIGHLLPAVRCYEKQSTLSILERAADYISEIQDKNDQLMYHNGDEVQAEEIQSLRQKLDDLKSERDRFADLLKTAGISTLLNATNSWKGKKANCTSSTSDCRPESADTTSNIPHLSADNSKKDNDQEGSTKSTKSKRRNTICAQLERIQNKNVTDKVTTALKMNTGNIIIPGLNNLNGMQTANVLPTNINQQQLFAAAPNLLASTLSNAILASNGHGHVIFSNANSAGGVVSIQAPTNQPGVTFVSPSPNILAGTDKGNGDGAGLLQIAMRDAGITTVTQSFLTQPSAQVPQITNQSTPAMIGSITSTNTEAVTSADSSQVPHSTPLQTLASIASNTQSINTGLIGSSFLGGTSCFQQGSTTMTNTTQAINSQVPIMSVGQTNYGQILQNGNTLINVPIINTNGQALPIGGALSGLTGIQGLQTQQGQIVLVNDHSGVSLMPNLQMVVDPAALALSNSTRQFTTPDKLAVTNKIEQSKMAFTGMMANPCDMINHTTTIPVQNQQQQQQSIFQNAINAQALASNPAAAAAAMQQLAYQPPQHTLSLGAANAILQQPQQLGATAAATTTTTHQQQQPILPTPFAGQSANFLNPNPGLVLPVSQNGNLLTLNTVPSQPNQLPTALILPNGHIIPVVTQPQVLLQQQLQQQQLQQQQLQQQLLNANCQLQTAAHPQTMHPSQLQTKVAVIGGLSNGTLPVIDSNLTTVLNPPNLQCQNQNAMLLSQQRAPVGLLMTTTISSFPMSNAATTVASMNNNMVTTSATQSVMTTQVQSSQTHRPTSAPAFIKRSDTQTSDSKGVVMSTTSVQPQVQLKLPSTSASESSVLLGNMSQANSLATVGTVPSQNDTSAVISSTLQPNINASLPLNQQTQGAGSNGTILITFGPPGQQACCILNSNTMQGIGNIANSQSVLTTTASASISTTTQSSSKKCSKKNSQRTIMPKPPKSNNSNTLGSVSSMNSSNSVSSTQVVSSGLWNSVSLNTDQEASSTSMQSVVSANEVCVTTSAESTITQSPSTSHTSDNAGTTDILAKAAESIFSSSLHDISPPISSFYNPANEDNPLHIDTSAGETEDDCSAQSPSKESCDSDNIPTSSRIEMEVESQSSHSLDNTCNSLTVTSNSASAFFKETDMCDTVGAISKRGRSKPEKDKLKTASKESKKFVNTKKIVKKTIPMEISDAINFATTEFTEVLDHVEAVAIEKRKVKSVAKDSAKKATLKVPAKKPAQSVDIPDEIVFTESEISDVLDQVENLRNTCWASETDPKKMKNRKIKSSCPEPDSEQPPSKKKKRVGKDYDSLLDGEAAKMNSSDCDNPISIEENPSELLSPDSTTVTKNVSNYTPSSTDGSPTGSGGDSICEKGVSYDPYDITLSLDEPESIKSFRSVDPSKSLCESNSHISDSYSAKIAERAQSAAEEITCTTSIQVTNSRASSRMLVTSPASTANSNVDNDNTGENNQIKMNGIVEPKQLHLHCDSQATSNAADDMLSKNSCSNQQMSTTSQTSSVNNLSSSQPQHPPCNLQSQQISTPNASLPSSVNSISTSVDPTEGSCVNSSAQMAPPCTTEHNSYSSPNSLRYSAESLFNPSNKLTTQSKSQLQSQAQISIPHHTSNITNSIGGEALSTTATLSTAAPVSSSKSRNSGIYSAENFVQSGRNDTSRSDNKHSYSSAVFSSTNNTVHHLSTSESDSLSFSNLGLSLTPTSSSSSSSNTYSESSSCNTSTSFTFSLTNSNNNSIFPSHQFPFLHLHSLVTSQHLHNDNTDSVNSNQQSQTFGLPSFSLNNQRNNSEAETSVPQNTPSGQIIVSGSSTTANHLQPHNTFNFGLGSSIESCSSSSSSRNQTFQDGSSLSLNSSGIDKSSSNSNVLSPAESNRDNSNPKHLPNVAQSISLSNRSQQPSLNTVDCSAQITSSVSTYFTPMNYQSLHTPPLHHPPVTSSESARANISRSFNANLSTPMTNFGSSTPVFNGRFDSNQLFSTQRDGASQNMNLNSDATKSAPHQISKVSKQQQSTAQHSLPQPQTQPTIGSLSSHQPIHSSSASSSSSSISTSPQVPNLGAPHQSTSQQQQQQQPPIQQQPQQPTPQQQQQQQRSAKQNSRAKQSQSKKNKQSFSDVDSNLSQSIFEPNMALYFPITNSSPPPPPPPPSSSRTIQSDTPSFMSGNLFTSSARQISNTSSTVLKNSDISTSFNTIFPPSRSQNGIGLNFQTGFGMNTVHSGHSNTPQIPPHSSSMPNLPHVSSLSLSNIFPDVSTSQSEALNISPIKFHTNSILPPPQAGMDPNALQHHHQSGALYHNRGHPPPPVIHNMSINSILGHNPHSFEARGPVAQAINSTVAPGFHGPSHSTFPMPPLNFSMHEH